MATSSVPTAPVARAAATPAAPPGTDFIPLDSSFGTAGLVPNISPTMRSRLRFVVQADDRVLVGGFVGQTPPLDFALSRLTRDGRPDPGFAGGLIAVLDGGMVAPFVTGFQLQPLPDGTVLLASMSGVAQGTDRRWLVTRATAEGQLDTSFSGDGRLTVTFPEAGIGLSLAELLVRSDGRILLVGSGAGSRLCLAQLLPDGRFDRTFGQEGKLVRTLPGDSGRVLGALLEPDGGLLVAGTTRLSDSFDDFLVARYRADGTPDPGFGVGGTALVDFGLGGEFGFVLRRLPDGALLVGGNAFADEGRLRPAVARLRPDGELDAAFGSGGRVVVDVRHEVGSLSGLEPLPDGRIAMVGTARTDHPGQPGTQRGFVALLGPDGRLDRHFAGSQEVVFLDRLIEPLNLRVDPDLAVQSDGKLLVTASHTAMVRLHPSTQLGALRLRIAADPPSPGPGALRFLVTVHNDGDRASGGVLTMRASKAVSLVSSSHGTVTVATNRVDVTGKLRGIPAGGSATVVLRTTVTGFEEGIGLSGTVSGGGPELITADNAASILVNPSRGATI